MAQSYVSGTIYYVQSSPEFAVFCSHMITMAFLSTGMCKFLRVDHLVELRSKDLELEFADRLRFRMSTL